jgi:hypothetical protein
LFSHCRAGCSICAKNLHKIERSRQSKTNAQDLNHRVMSSVASMAVLGITAPPQRFDAGGRDRARASSANPALSANREILDRFQPASGLQRVEQTSSTWRYDFGSIFTTHYGLVVAPNVDLAGGASGAFTSYGLAFNSPIMHLYTQTTKALVDILA